MRLAEKILKQLSAIYPNPVGIIRTDGIILAHSTTYLQGQFCRPAVELLQSKQEELLVPSDNVETNLPGLYLPVFLNQNVVCILLVHYGIQEDLHLYGRLLQEICRLSVEEFFSGNYFNLQRYERSLFCLNWLEGKYANDTKAFYDLAPVNGIDASAGVTCAALRIHQTQLNQSLKFFIAEILDLLNCFYVSRNSDFILIFNTKSPKVISMRLSLIEENIKPHVTHFLIAVGQAHECPQLQDSYLEALKLLHYYGSTTDGVLYYQTELVNLYLYDAPPELKQQLLNQIFGEFSSQERKQACELIYTYIACNGSIQQMSQTLFVHKNTIQYRIEQLHKRTGYDLRRISDCHMLSVACKWTRT